MSYYFYFFFFQAEDGIRDGTVTGVQTCALPICNALQQVDFGFGISDFGITQRLHAEFPRNLTRSVHPYCGTPIRPSSEKASNPKFETPNPKYSHHVSGRTGPRPYCDQSWVTKSFISRDMFISGGHGR